MADGDTGNLSINGTLSFDSINEKTNSSGVAIENVLLKDGDISGNDASFNNVEANAIILNNVDLTTSLSGKQDSLTFNPPSSNNTNPSTSAQIKTYVDGKITRSFWHCSKYNKRCARCVRYIKRISCCYW